MQTTFRKTETKSKGKEKTSKDDATPLSKKPLDEKLKRSVYSVSTPRNYIQKSTTADIYAQKKNIAAEVAKAPKKVVGTTNKSSNESPMKNLLKSSSSSVSQVSAKKVRSSPQIKTEAKVVNSARRETPRKNKDLPLLNVTVNSPIPKRRLENRDDDKRAANAEARTLKKEDGRKSSRITDKRKETIKDTGQKSTNREARKTKEKSLVTKEVSKKSFDADTKEVGERHRTKTRTLNDNEVKVLTPDAVDNNAEMLNLSKRLSAKPKAFFVDLDDSTKAKSQITEKSSEDEVEYEDDFESYESDFDSYHGSSHSEEKSVDDVSDDQGTREQANESNNDVDSDKEQRGNVEEEGGLKEGKDEEKMLDSGNFDLRDSRSANKLKTGTMGHIQEDSEMDVRSSLTDEGFQDMSSAGCSIRTVHSDLLERPIFIDFKKSKENKRKRKIFEKLKQRAKDILSMVTLHEMSYSLFEMKPIPYDLYMATFGRSNYIQTAAQTFDDGINVEVQTEEILSEDKWTQHPIQFSNHDIYLKQMTKSRKYSYHTEDYLTKFTFLIGKSTNPGNNNMINSDDDYKSNPLRMYFEQKDGVGPAEMLPYENYKNKLKNNDFNTGKLTKFLKKRESRISSILSANSGNSKGTDLVKSTKYPFSKGYVSISTKTMAEEKYPFLKQIKVTGVIFSETKSNLILTVHKNCTALDEKCVICLWDMSVLRKDPIKILIAIDNVNIGRFKGSTNGIFVGALDDGSVHIWDMTEEPTWYPDVASSEKSDLVEVETRAMTQLENDREWNLKNSHVVYESIAPQFALQACAFTSSAIHMLNGDSTDSIVGLEVEMRSSHSQDGGRKVLGQVCTLQRIGILAIWSIIQEKMKSTPDMGKAYWSKIKLELNQTISLIEHIDLPVTSSMENTFVQSSFNMNAAKRRTSLRRKDKSLKKHLSRQKSIVKPDSSRPASAASAKNTFIPQNNWECGLVCNDLKIMRLDSSDNYLVARNCGEVLCCTRSAGIFKINRFCVATDTSSVTSIDVYPHSLPYFLAATDSGTVNLCSLLEARVLLTLDCRNGPPTPETEKYHTDHKGRFLGASIRPQSAAPVRPISSIAVKSVRWSPVNACCIFALLSGGALMSWELTHSDIHAKHSSERAAKAWSVSDNSLALLSPEGEVQVHMLTDAQHTRAHQELFQKYIALL